MKPRRRVGTIICQEKRFLLVKTTKHNNTHYYDAGGGIEVGETSIQTIHREIKEELNAKVGDATYISSRTFPSHCHPKQIYEEEIFIVTLLTEPTPASEIDEIRWVTYEESKSIPIMQSTRELIEIAKERNLID